MIWNDCELLALGDSGEKDELNNPIYKSVVVLKTKCRHSPWTAEELQLLNRETTTNHLRFVLKTRLTELVKNADYLKVGEAEYSIKTITINPPRYCVCEVKKYGD